MKKITKVVCSTALIVGMLGTAQAFSVSAMIRPIITGDVDENFKVDINDVTLLQNGLTGNMFLNKSNITDIVYTVKIDISCIKLSW